MDYLDYAYPKNSYNSTNIEDGNPEYQYQTGQITSDGLFTPKTDFEAADSIAEAVDLAVRIIIDISNYIQAKAALERIEPQIEAMMPESGGGVLVGLTYQENEAIDSPRYFMYAWIVGAGYNPKQVAKECFDYFYKQGTLSSATLDSYTKSTSYIWIFHKKMGQALPPRTQLAPSILH